MGIPHSRKTYPLLTTSFSVENAKRFWSFLVAKSIHPEALIHAQSRLDTRFSLLTLERPGTSVNGMFGGLSPRAGERAIGRHLILSVDEGEDMSIWTVLFIILLIAWLGGFTVFHVASGLIHLLLVFAVISLILHFVLGGRTV